MANFWSRGKGFLMIWTAVQALVTLSLGMLAAVPAADAQQPSRILRVGVLYPGGSAPLSPRMEAFRQGLRQHGYVEGTNIAIEIRYADGRGERLAKLATELVESKVNVIATSGDLATRVVQQTSVTIPIVAFTDDLVGTGLVASLPRPGGNTTGVTIMSPELTAKRLELLKAAVPRVSRVAALWDPATGASQVKAIEAAAKSLGVRLLLLKVEGPDDFESAFQTAKKQRAGALNVLASPFLASYSKTIIDLAAKNRLPAIYQWKEHAEAGGLMSYGPILLETWRQTGFLVGKVLKGAKPADLPVEQPMRFELAVNLKTAKALGITFPQSILIRADQMIQ